MPRKPANPNRHFMIVNGILAFAIFAVVCLFLYMSFRFQRKADRVYTYEGAYTIELTRDFAGDSLSLYLNDSLLLQRTLPDSALTLSVHRFAEENVLMVVDARTDRVSSFNLPAEGGHVKVEKKDGEVTVEESK